MHIFLDEKPLEFKIENEETIEDIIQALTKWLLENNFFIERLIVDDNEIDYTDSNTLKEISIKNVSNIKIKTISIHELKLSQLTTIQQYFNIILNNIETKNNNNLINVLKDYKNIKPFLNKNLDKIYDNSSEGFIEKILNNRAKISEYIDELKSFSENIITITEARKSEIIDPVKEIELLKNNFETISEKTGNVSILLQTGKDTEAMKTVLEFVEFSKKLSRLLNYLSLENKIILEKEKITGFNNLLISLCDALENSDSVLVGDLLEYEIIPVVETLLITTKS